MNIPDDVLEAGWAASYAAPVPDAPKAFMQVVAEWARREALREAELAASSQVVSSPSDYQEAAYNDGVADAVDAIRSIGEAL
ncbi:hypothetical protein [Leifsonia sp. Root227]|uniref:hypothetical protein n=1 Tax=Leifsonia sp. Root227 TaxID=1736496 RepID=UPI000A7B44AC|nr:hypothetical protein [Leifsonia sp. Root227]